MHRLLLGILVVGAIVAAVLWLPDTAPPAPAGTITPPPTTTTEAPERDAGRESLLALRRYEHLINGRRGGALEVRWLRVPHAGGWAVRDVTRHRMRWDRMMGRVRDTFRQDVVTTTLRTEDGDLIRMESETSWPSRTDTTTVERTDGAYRVVVKAGDNEESFTIPAPDAAKVDPEAFLCRKIQAGEAKPGSRWSYLRLEVGRKRVAPVELEVVGPDDEGPGLKVVERTDGQTSLWWFADDGSVTRLRIGTTVIRRDDSVGLGDLPRRGAAQRITLPVDVRLPRIFTSKTMVVDVIVKTDETLRPPRIPANPFTQVLEETDDRVRLLLRSHDQRDRTTSLPIDPAGFEEALKPTPLMEVDSPRLRTTAREIIGDAADARSAAARIADYVFRLLRKQSPDIPSPTALQILDNPIGDCSEHNLLFTALCRAGGIPARRCSGYVNIGDDWGAHGWSEIWVGEWIGADPTTNEVGTRARYIFLASPDDPDVRPAALVAERTRIRTRRVEFEDGVVEFDGGGDVDDVLMSGIRLGPLPAGWKAMHNARSASISGPGFAVMAAIRADHGYRAIDILLTRRWRGGRRATFGGREAVVAKHGGNSTWEIPLGRQNLLVQIATVERGSAPPLAAIQKVFEPTLKREE